MGVLDPEYAGSNAEANASNTNPEGHGLHNSPPSAQEIPYVPTENWFTRNWESVAATVLGVLTAVSAGTLAPGIAAAILVKKGLESNLVQEAVGAAAEAYNTGVPYNPEDGTESVMRRQAEVPYEPGVQGTSGDPSEAIPDGADPAHPDFWDYYVDRFFGTDSLPSFEEMVIGNAEFMRNSAIDLQNTIAEINEARNTAAQNAVSQYDTQINGLLNQANAQSGIYKPVGFSFGDFKHTWTPRQGLNLGNHISGLAKDELAAELGLADYVGENNEQEALLNHSLAGTLSPFSGDLSFMQELQRLGLTEYAAQNNLNLAQLNNQSPEPTDLQVWSEVINTSSAAADLWEQLFGED